MSYDYSSENKLLELPNPYRVENFFLFACAAITLAGGLTALMWARAALQSEAARLGVAPLLVGTGLLAAAVTFAAIAARRLRFFFGRGRPHSLAPEVAVGATGNSAAADHFKNMLRQSGLEYPEPHGALNGLLYHLMPRLITAPLIVQTNAQRQFFNALAFLATLVSFVFAWDVFGTEPARPLISIAYFVFGAWVLLKPLVANEQASLGTRQLIGLAVAAIVGPVAVGLLGPSLPRWHLSMAGQTLTLLLCALGAVVLLLCALRAQVDASPHTQRSCEQRSLSMNGPPGALITELDRKLQAAWVSGIPNRRYTRLEPVTQGTTGSGRFAGELMEETQPVPMAGTAPVTFDSALRSPRHVWLLLADLYGMLLTLLGTVCALVYVRGFDPQRLDTDGGPGVALVGYAAVFLAIGAFCFRSAAAIWGRFNFESELLWVELLGTWQTSSIGTGNQLSSQLQTRNEVVRVEGMTLRVWRARIESVVFGKDGWRQVTAMYGASQGAATLADDLERFAAGQSVFIAPKAAEDRQRIDALRATESLLGGAAGGSGQAALGAGALHETLRVEAAHPPGQVAGVYCAGCGARAQVGARFCSACGQALQGA